MFLSVYVYRQWGQYICAYSNGSGVSYRLCYIFFFRSSLGVKWSGLGGRGTRVVI